MDIPWEILFSFSTCSTPGKWNNNLKVKDMEMSYMYHIYMKKIIKSYDCGWKSYKRTSGQLQIIQKSYNIELRGDLNAKTSWRWCKSSPPSSYMYVETFQFYTHEWWIYVVTYGHV